MFYAGSILGLNTLGILLWRQEGGATKYWRHVFVSRIQDKSVAFTITLLERMLAQTREAGSMEGISKLQLLSDAGTRFRSYGCLGTQANQMQAPTEHRHHQSHVRARKPLQEQGGRTLLGAEAGLEPTGIGDRRARRR